MISNQQKLHRFSTLTAKSNVPNKEQHQKIMGIFQNTSPTKRNVHHGPQADTEALREQLFFGDASKIDLILWKKGKMLGKNVFRDVTLTRTETDLFQMTQEKHKKSYDAPTEFVSETKEEYKAKLAEKVDKKKLLAWDAKEVSGSEYRIMFRRKAGSEGDNAPDMAYYFYNKEDWIKTKCYLKFIQLLESQSQQNEKPNVLLENLSMAFSNIMALRIRRLIKTRAKAIEEEIRAKKILKAQDNLLLAGINRNVLRTFMTSWEKYSENAELYKKEQEQEAIKRKEKVLHLARNSPMLQNLDEDLVKKFTREWRMKLTSQFIQPRRDISILFNVLELASDVIQPSLKIEIRFKKDYPEIPVINGKKIESKFKEFQLYCRRQESYNHRVTYWSISSIPRATDSPMFTTQGNETNFTTQSDTLNEERFSLSFSNFRMEFLDTLEIKAILYDDSNTILGYHYASLKSLMMVIDRGNELWIGFKANSLDRKKFPLLNLSLRSSEPKRGKKQSSVKLGHKIQVEEYIQDTFYNYRFKMPELTPKHLKLLQLLPEELEMFEKKQRGGNKEEQRAYSTEQAYQNLTQYYYRFTTRQIAHVTRCAYFWSELTEELMAIASKEETKGDNQIFIDEWYLKKLVHKQVHPEDKSPIKSRPAILDNAVSFFFKRDQWKKKPEWSQLSDKLRNACRKGIPPQYRISYWSELTKSAYFIELTDTLLKKNGIYTEIIEEGEDFAIKTRRVYETLKKESEKENIYLYQALEDDFEYLRRLEGKEKIKNERYIRKICKTFITWSKMFSSSETPSKVRYCVPYSRNILILCYGIVVCQTCRFIENQIIVEEDQIFWLLVSLTTYTLASYYETSPEAVGVDLLNLKPGETVPEPKKKNSLIPSALGCNAVKGVKHDLLLLKIMLKENEKDIYYKFEELGLPLEYYLAEHMLTLFVNLFNPGLTFRFWDILLFEGSGADGAKCNRMIVSILCAFLKECKTQILQAKNAEDLKLIIELNGKFYTKYGEIIKNSYQTYFTCFDPNMNVSMNKKKTILDKLERFKTIMFTDISKNITTAMTQIETRLENYYQPILQQNKAFSQIGKSLISRYGNETDPLSYTVLQKMIEDFHGKYVQSRTKIFPRTRLTSVQIRIHRILLNSHGNNKIAIDMGFKGKTISKDNITPLSPDVEANLPIDPLDGITHDIVIEIYSQHGPTTSQIIGSLCINAKSYPPDTINKVVLKIKSEGFEVKKGQADCSEIELSILVQASGPEDPLARTQPFFVPDLENPHYKLFKNKIIENIEAGGRVDTEHAEGATPIFKKNANVDKLPLPINNTSHKWKEILAISYENFSEIIKTIAPTWFNAVDLKVVYDGLAKADQNDRFDILNFFVVLILCCKLTSNQRNELFYQVLSSFNQMLSQQKDQISTYLVKEFFKFLYQAYMTYIPQNEIESAADLAIFGSACYIRKVTLNGTHKIKPDHPAQVLNRLANYMSISSNQREIQFNSKEVIKTLRTVYEKDRGIDLQGKVDSKTNRNELTIHYVVNGTSHSFILYVDNKWNKIDDHKDKDTSSSSEFLKPYDSIISLNNPIVLLQKEEFLKAIRRMPLLDYFGSLENTNFGSTLDMIQTVKFTMLIENESCYTAKPNFSPDIVIQPQSARSARPTYSSLEKVAVQLKAQKKFTYYQENWETTVNRARYLRGNVSKFTTEESTYVREDQIPCDKLNIFMSYSRICKALKKRAMQVVSDFLDQSKKNIEHLNINMFHKNFWLFDYKVSIKIHGQTYAVPEDAKSPYQTLLNLLEKQKIAISKDNMIEIIYSLNSDTLLQDQKNKFVQIAKYSFNDGTCEWLPCVVDCKYQFVDFRQISIQNSGGDFNGFGVIFERFPKEFYLKPKEDVIFVHKTDLNELELKKIEI